MPLAEYTFFVFLAVICASAGLYFLARVICAVVGEFRYWIAQLTDPVDTGE